jgi:hypothetical protein
MDKNLTSPEKVTKAPITPKGVSELLYDNFSDVRQTAISHVVANGEGDNLYVVLVHVKGKTSKAAASGKAELSSEPRVDELDRSLSGQLTNLFSHVVAFDGCTDLTKPHCAGSSKGYRLRGKKGKTELPSGRGFQTVKGEAHTKNHAFVSSEVPANKVQPIFETMERIAEFGVGD